MKKQVSALVEEYLTKRPVLLYYASEGIVNVSSLARRIKREIGITKSDDAVMVALYRYLEGFGKVKIDEEKVTKVLQETSANIRSDYAVAIFHGQYKGEADALISFGKMSAAIGEAKILRKHRQDAFFYLENLALVELKHKENIEHIPGVMFYLLARFYEKNVSIVEVFSAWDATYILIEKKDLPAVFEMFFAGEGK